MANVLIRDLPDEVHTALQRQARQSGRSLQQYLAAELRRLAERPSINDLFDRIERHEGGQVGLGRAVEDLVDERSRT